MVGFFLVNGLKLDMGKNSRYPFALTKQGPEPLLHRDRTAYPNHERACRVYSQWLSGYSEEEVANFFGIQPRDVELDVQHVHGILPTRTVISHNNDRARLLVQRQQSEEFRRLMGEALKTPATDYLNAGISPAGILKEYREATGMVQKAEPLLQINTQINSNAGSGQAITSAEDAIRRVLAAMAEEQRQAAAPPASDSISPAMETQVDNNNTLLYGQDDKDEPS
jgi:hypothetical protein